MPLSSVAGRQVCRDADSLSKEALRPRDLCKILRCVPFEIIRLRCGLVRSRQPQRTAQIVRARAGAGFEQPLLVYLVCFVRVDEHVPIFVFGAWFADANFLVPAVLAADVVGLYRKRQVLMNTGVFPENSFRVGIVALERLDTVYRPHHPFALADLF